MKDVPIGCADRLRFIETHARELSKTFLNGNRKDLLEELENMPPRVAFAVLATIMRWGSYEIRPSLMRFLQEMA